MSEARNSGTEERDWVSKSQIKRELAALQKLAARLVALNPGLWPQLGLGQSMLDALDESKRTRGHSAMRRHIRRLGKLLRDEDTSRVEGLFDRLENKNLKESQRFHRLERWRERLIAGGDRAFAELLQQCPDADRQHLQRLIRACRKEWEQERPPAAQRKLFRYLRTLPLE